MNPSNQPLSDCHQAPVVFCEGNAWDVPLESIKPGSTYGYGCPVCHKACGLNADAVDSNHTPSIPTTALPGNGQPDAQAGDDDTDVTISHAQAEVGLRERLEELRNDYMIGYYNASSADSLSQLNSNDRLFVDQLIALFQAERDAAVRATEKAYGGCHNCYGKGYSTWRHGETSRGQTHNLRVDIKYCSCERGLQLSGLVEADKSAAVAEARLDEIDMALAIKGKIYLHGSIVSAFDEQANTIDPKMLEMRRESLARLQPPTAGEGESV